MPDKLNASVAQARDFLKTYFPAWADAKMRCHSWLLSPVLKELLPENSRILHFQAAFDLLAADSDSDGALTWVYQMTDEQAKEADFRLLPEKTTLQKNLKARLLAGGHSGEGRGELVRAFA